MSLLPPQDMREMQMDTVSYTFRDYLPVLDAMDPETLSPAAVVMV